jgi:hypothetical protein
MLEPQAINEYTSERTFNIYEASWGSHALVLHSFGGMFLGDAINLVFLAVDRVDLPYEIGGLRVSQPCDNEAVEYERKFGAARKLEEPAGKRVFAVESAGKRFHVIAAKMWVLIRPHDPTLSLRPLLDSNSEGRDEFINKHLKEWYTMDALAR